MVSFRRWALALTALALFAGLACAATASPPATLATATVSPPSMDANAVSALYNVVLTTALNDYSGFVANNDSMVLSGSTTMATAATFLNGAATALSSIAIDQTADVNGGMAISAPIVAGNATANSVNPAESPHAAEVRYNVIKPQENGATDAVT